MGQLVRQQVGLQDELSIVLACLAPELSAENLFCSRFLRERSGTLFWYHNELNFHLLIYRLGRKWPNNAVIKFIECLWL